MFNNAYTIAYAIAHLPSGILHRPWDALVEAHKNVKGWLVL